MKKEDVVRQYTTPIAAPAFVQGPHRFKRREYLNITYRTDGEALAKLVPEPLEIDQPLVRFEVMKMPDTTGYGAYVECGHAAVVRMDREQGEFLLAMYLDNLPAIAAGRELSAFPKKLGSAKLFVDSDTLVGTLDYGALRVATATMGYKHKPLDLEKARHKLVFRHLCSRFCRVTRDGRESANWYAPKLPMLPSKVPGSGLLDCSSSNMRLRHLPIYPCAKSFLPATS
jgi:acetoacetate decarboxylase